MNSLAQRFDTSGPASVIKHAKAIIEEDGDDLSDLMWGSYGGFGNLATGIPNFNIPAVPDVSPLSLSLGVVAYRLNDRPIAQCILAITHRRSRRPVV